MNKVFLDIETGTYYAFFQKPPVNGKIEQMLMAPPENEIAFINLSEKREMLMKAIEMCKVKIQETDGEERKAYEEHLYDSQKELKEMFEKQQRKMGGKPKQIRCRIIDHHKDGYYEVHPINWPKKWKKQWENEFKKVNGEE